MPKLARSYRETRLQVRSPRPTKFSRKGLRFLVAPQIQVAAQEARSVNPVRVWNP
jgi:hypothetical protein